jgi:guanine nucleotide-binding protein subunit gamma, fungi
MTDLVVKQATPVTSILLSSTNNSNDSLIQYTKATKDYMVPSVWGAVDKKDDPYAPTAQGGCCVVM